MHVNRVFIVVQNPKVPSDISEMYISLKQATGLLMKCNHDFRLMIAELICVNEGKIVLRDLIRQAYQPMKLNINQNSSKIFPEQTTKFPDFVDPDSNI